MYGVETYLGYQTMIGQLHEWLINEREKKRGRVAISRDLAEEKNIAVRHIWRQTRIPLLCHQCHASTGSLAHCAQCPEYFEYFSTKGIQLRSITILPPLSNSTARSKHSSIPSTTMLFADWLRDITTKSYATSSTLKGSRNEVIRLYTSQSREAKSDAILNPSVARGWAG